ncbi:MAG: RNA polymerase sigma factor (sigma-70 family) [Bradymonadia bacterium]
MSSLSAIAAGDARAFGQWMSAAEPRVRLSLRSFAAQVDTEAVVQESFLRVWQVAPRIEPDGKPEVLLRFTVRVARNLAIDHVRRDRRMQPTDAATLDRMRDAEVPPAQTPDPLLRRTIQQCRDALPKKPAQALTARLSVGGQSPDATVAGGLGMRLNTFLQNLSRARRLLAACLTKQGVMP